MAQTIEQRTARAILETDEETINIGGTQYTYGKPTLATIIMVSELVAELPTFPTQVDSSGVVHAVLQGAKDERVIGKILACLILGAKRIKEKRHVTLEAPVQRWWQFWKRTKAATTKLEYDHIAEQALDNLDVSDAVAIISTRLGKLNISGFFALTTSLKTEADILKPTKSGVESQTTAYGQSSSGSPKTSVSHPSTSSTR